MNDKFCLKWNDFQANVSNTFKRLRTSDQFYDVTQVSDDQQQVSAHKIVLSSSSEYFKSILTSKSHSHPMLCLSGVSSTDMKNILDFIYNGEIQICQDNLDQFLTIAQRFKLEGLLQEKEENIPAKREFEEDLEGFHEDEKLDSGVPEAEGVLSHVKSQKIISMDSANFENIEELDRQINQMIEKVDGSYKRKCIPCGKINRDISHAREHAETHIEGLSFPCQYCGKTFRSRHSLRVHKCSFISFQVERLS